MQARADVRVIGTGSVDYSESSRDRMNGDISHPRGQAHNAELVQFNVCV
jgi:hypothetical protein